MAPLPVIWQWGLLIETVKISDIPRGPTSRMGKDTWNVYCGINNFFPSLLWEPGVIPVGP